MEQPQTHTPQKPVIEHKDGAIKAAVWQNEGANGPYHTVSIFRIYKAQDGNWKQTKSFRAKDMPVVARVATELNQQLAALA